MSSALRRISEDDASARAEAESWFLQRGLPSVLTTRGRWRRLWSRSAPILAAQATIQACGIPIILIAGGREVHIEGPTPTNVEWIVLGILIAALPLATLVGLLVPRLRGRARTVAGITAAVVAAVAGVVDGGASSLPQTAIISRRGLHPDGLWLRVSVRVGDAHDGVTLRDRRRAGSAGLAGGSIDCPGVLQHLRLADGGDDQRVPARAGDGISGHHRGFVRHIRDGGTGSANVAIADRAARG